MPYNFVTVSFHINKLCSRLSSSEVRFYPENGRFAFLSPFGGLEATYYDHLRLIGKRVVEFLLVSVNWTFLLGVRSYGWGATSEYRLKTHKILHQLSTFGNVNNTINKQYCGSDVRQLKRIRDVRPLNVDTVVCSLNAIVFALFTSLEESLLQSFFVWKLSATKL